MKQYKVVVSRIQDETETILVNQVLRFNTLESEVTEIFHKANLLGDDEEFTILTQNQKQILDYAY
jgi:hypothetical protein